MNETISLSSSTTRIRAGDGSIRSDMPGFYSIEVSYKVKRGKMGRFRLPQMTNPLLLEGDREFLICHESIVICDLGETGNDSCLVAAHSQAFAAGEYKAAHDRIG